MIPAAFDYVRVDTAEGALAALVEHGDDAKLLAGGMSLLPLMKLRLAVPAVLVDVGGLRELSYVRDEGDHLSVGALTRHYDLERHELVSRHCGLLAAVAARVGDPQVRHRGTLGGSVAHGDPASDLPAALVALDATVVITGADGDRDVDAADFFHGFLDTALGPEELLREVRIPKSDRDGFAFEKFQRRRAGLGDRRSGRRRSLGCAFRVRGRVACRPREHGVHADPRPSHRGGAGLRRHAARRRGARV